MSDFSKVLEKFSAVPWRATLFVLGLSFIAASVFSTVIAKVFLPQGKPVPRSTVADTFNVPPPTASLNQAGVDLILKRNLFNSEGAAEEKKTDVSPEHPSQEAVKSDLPVKLVGTIYGGDPYSGLALVENSQKRTINSFMVGDSLMKDATVKEVHKEKIIIDRNGRLEFIEIDRQEVARNSRKKKKAAPASSAPAGLTPITTGPAPEKFHEDGFERDKTEMNMSEPYRQKLLTTDFPKVLQDAKASPKMCEGGLCGFCLTRIRQDSIYEKAGFQNDDCVTEINGVPLTDTAQAIKLLQSLRNEKEIEVRLERGGAPMKFNLNIH
jgi:general secretion pathway protein C